MDIGSEVKLAELVIAFLQDQQWDIYQEVAPRRHGSVADIVAVRDGIVWIVECKLRYGLDVISQAHGWMGWAHYVSIATPYSKNYCHILDDYIKWKGIGRILASEYESTTRIPPKLFRKPPFVSKIKKVLCDEHKTFAKAGNNYGRRYSPFQATCNAIRQTVEREPGICLKALIDSIDHHYASKESAKHSVSYWAKHGKISGIVAKREGKNIKFYLGDKCAN